MTMIESKMIAVEGIEGAGKSTVLDNIKHYLDEKKLSYICVREPGGTQLGESLRDLLKSNSSEHVLPETELLLMYASRTQLYHNVIKPALDKGSWVISDRFELSSYAYQGIGRGLDLKALNFLSGFCLKGFKPDLTLYLDVSYEVSQRRLLKRGIEKDRIEQEGKDFFNSIRNGYLDFSKEDPLIQVIDASESLIQVKQSIVDALERLWITV